ncbi:hypothetical protein Lser_V15G04907 [Lactuca serriola]
MDAIINAIIEPIVGACIGRVADHVRYLISSKTIVQKMYENVNILHNASFEVQQHVNRDKNKRCRTPKEVEIWLDQVTAIDVKVETLNRDVVSCSLKSRYKVGSKASKIIEEINSVIRGRINWTDDPIPLGEVDPMNSSTSRSSSDHDDFPSREQTFTKVLKALEPDHKFKVIALWGMGGVGKSMMIKKLKKVVEGKQMFKFMVEVDIGETDPIAVQEGVAYYLNINLGGGTKQGRAKRLGDWFVANSNGGETKFLVILDNVWETVDLNDIGLSLSPNQNVDFKVLLASRDRSVCTRMGAETESVFQVEVLAEAEAQSLFARILESSYHDDPDLKEIGKDIVRKCCGLPAAIKNIAQCLKEKTKETWKDTLYRLENHEIHNIASTGFEISYNNLKNEEIKSIFLLCGLLLEKEDILTEELIRYGWGLQLFNKVNTIKDARNRLYACIEELMHKTLLMGSDDGSVKMHDLMGALVLDMFSKPEHAAIVNHGSTKWPENEKDVKYWKWISLTCEGMPDFPRHLSYPNLTILRLMHGSDNLPFHENVYKEMKKLQVISFDHMKCPPLLPSSPKYSTELRVLHLHQCTQKFDCSSIGKLWSLEVLSFASSSIDWLPSTIGGLKKLKLLDLTDCDAIRIDEGVLSNLFKLEELYTVAGGQCGIMFTDDNCSEMEERSKKLTALEFQFFGNNAQAKNMCFGNLERFKISMGRSLDRDFSTSRHSYENNLQLDTNVQGVRESKMNELFKKTQVLCLSVGDMNNLEDVEVSSQPSPFSSFVNLRVLVFSSCEKLKYLFTHGVAKGLSKLEHLHIEACPNMKELIKIEDGGDKKITFPKLKFLYLHGLPNFTSIFPKDKLPTSCILKEQVVIPKLEKLHIKHMEDLEDIWPSRFSRIEEVKLTEIEVSGCNKLVNLFPSNPLPYLHHLKELKVEKCGSIKVLFNMGMESADKIEPEGVSSSLRSIQVKELGNLTEVWRITDENKAPLLMHRFLAVESVIISDCTRFINVLTPTTFDLKALMPHMKISISKCGENWTNNDLVEREIQMLDSAASSSTIPSNAVEQVKGT